MRDREQFYREHHLSAIKQGFNATDARRYAMAQTDLATESDMEVRVAAYDTLRELNDG